MKAILKKSFMIVCGTVILAIALDLFLIPANIAPGGMSGLSIVINHLTNIPVGVLVLALNIPIFLWSMRYFDYKFLLYSLFGMIVLSVSIDTFAFIRPVTNDLILSSVYGGALMGLGVGIVFRCGATTGGTEIIAQILKEHFPEFSVGKFVLIIDAIIVVVAGLVYGRWEVALYSASALYVSAFVVDLIVEGGDFAKMVLVISDKPKEITEKVSENMSRGTTALSGSSMYTNTEKTVLMCVVKQYEIGKLKNIIQSVDDSAFVIVSDTREVLGNGFKKHSKLGERK